MLIGYATDNPFSSDPVDREQLRQTGCERILSPETGVYSIHDALNFLRAGDILVIPRLSQLGSTVNQVIESLARFHSLSIKLQVLQPPIVPGSPLGDTFIEAAAVLAALDNQQKSLPAKSGRLRGRPLSLSPEVRARVEHMLVAGRMSVPEVARLVKVSPATLYRHFPQAKK